LCYLHFLGKAWKSATTRLLKAAALLPNGLKNWTPSRAVAAAITRMEQGNLSRTKSVGEGVLE
jgi:putative component of toxin-antitoxin plasmid stabilization module